MNSVSIHREAGLPELLSYKVPPCPHGAATLAGETDSGQMGSGCVAVGDIRAFIVTEADGAE